MCCDVEKATLCTPNSSDTEREPPGQARSQRRIAKPAENAASTIPIRIRIGTTTHASATLDPRRDELDALTQVLVDAEVHAREYRRAREQRAEQGGEDALQDERCLDEPVRGADEAHDAELPPARVGRQADRGRDEQHRGDQHEGGDADGDVGRDRERREEGLEVLQLVLDLLDALHAP